MWFVKGGNAATFLKCITLNSTTLHSATFPILLSSRNTTKWIVVRQVINVTSLVLKKSQGKPHCELLGQFILLSMDIAVHLFKETEISVPVMSFWTQLCSLSQPQTGCEWEWERAGAWWQIVLPWLSFESFPVRSAGNVLLLMSAPAQLPGTLHSQQNLGFLPTTATVCFR